MTAPTDAALRERVQRALVAKLAHAYGMDILDAVLAAIPEPPVRRVELDGSYYTTWDGRSYVIQDTVQPTYRDCVGSAAAVCVGYVGLNTKRDAKHAELIALRGDVKPSWWINHTKAQGYAGAYATEQHARASVIDATLYERIAVPVYEHPPATLAPMREVVGHAHIGSEYTSVWVVQTGSTTADTLRAARNWEQSGGGGGTVVELLRGDVVQS